ncbi:MAG: hypothetical protein WDM96_10260 [Lacunisphaera sp.]
MLLIQPGFASPLAFLELATRTPFFLKAAHVDVSADGREWQSLGPAVPLFRQFGAEQLQLKLGGQPAAFVRITLDDAHSRPVEFTGARIFSRPGAGRTGATGPDDDGRGHPPARGIRRRNRPDRHAARPEPAAGRPHSRRVGPAVLPVRSRSPSAKSRATSPPNA